MVKKTKEEKDIFEQEAKLRLAARKKRHRKKRNQDGISVLERELWKRK